MSYLSSSYLDDGGAHALGDEATAAPTVPSNPVTVQDPEAMITLPGGIIVKKRTMVVLAIATITVAILWMLSQKKKKG